MKKPVVLAISAMGVALVGIGLIINPPKSEASSTSSGVMVPYAGTNALLEIELPDLAGKSQPLSQWKGKILVVNYWATWCPPCRDEMPGFSRLHQRYAAKGVQFVGISIDSADKVRDFQKMTPVSYPLLVGGMEAAATSADIGNPSQGLPFTAIFDRSGALHSVKLGRFKEADLEQRLQELLK
jgi:peroxiredoxin